MSVLLVQFAREKILDQEGISSGKTLLIPAACEMVGQRYQEHRELQQEDFGKHKWQKHERERTSRKEMVMEIITKLPS